MTRQNGQKVYADLLGHGRVAPFPADLAGQGCRAVGDAGWCGSEPSFCPFLFTRFGLRSGKSPFFGLWRGNNETFNVMMPSSNEVLALYSAATDSWSGFAPDFLKLMSADLQFSYDIVNEMDLCPTELVEAFRA